MATAVGLAAKDEADDVDAKPSTTSAGQERVTVVVFEMVLVCF